MKENTRKEFDRIKAEATRLFGTSDLTFNEYPLHDGYGLEIRLTIWAGNRVYDLMHGSVDIRDTGTYVDYGIRTPCNTEHLLEIMDEDYRRNLEGCRKYIMEETKRALDALP